MEKLVNFLKRLPIYLLILALVGYGVKRFMDQNQPPEVLSDVIPTVPTQVPTQPEDPASLLKNVVSVGGYFDIYPRYGDGHFRCRIINATVVQDASVCPPKELFYDGTRFVRMIEDGGGYASGEYEEWFVEGGAYDHGDRVILIELEMTNVDFVGRIYDGSFTSEDGYFKDPYAIQPYMPIQLADLARSYVVQGYRELKEYDCKYFSELGKYGEDDPETIGSEQLAIQILPGETKTCTLGFLVENKDGKPVDMSMLRVILNADSYTETGIFIELGLENEEG